MKKRIIITLAIGIISILVFLILIFFPSRLVFSKICISKEEWNSIIYNREDTNLELVNNIKFNGYDLIYDKKNNIWYYSIIENNSNGYNPYISYKTNENIKISFENKKITNKLIENNEDIKFIVYTDTKYHIYSLKCTTLPIMNITYSNNDKITKDKSISMEIYLFDNRNNATQRVIKSSGDIHERGRTTLVYPKKGYKISLTKKSMGNNKRNNDISLLGMRKDDDWILYAGYNDQEKIRNVFSSNLWYYSCANNNNYKIKNGMEYKYIELFFNGEYWGLYALGFPIDEKQLNLKIDSTGEYKEYLFKKISWNNSEKKLSTQNTKLAGYELCSKTGNEKEAWNLLKSFYEKMENTNDISQLYKIVDINNSIDIYLFFNLIQGRDNVDGDSIKNIYITIKNNGILYTPWDLDVTWGNLWVAKAKNYTKMYGRSVDINSIMNLNVITYLKNMNDKRINELIKKRYNELRNGYWSDSNLSNLIDKYEQEIYYSGAFLRDKIRWPNGNYNEEKIKLKDFKNHVMERLKYMDIYIQNIE